VEEDLQPLVDKGYFGRLEFLADDVTGYFAALHSCIIESAPKQRNRPRVVFWRICDEPL
jgi:hypothetical protein